MAFTIAAGIATDCTAVTLRPRHVYLALPPWPCSVRSFCASSRQSRSNASPGRYTKHGRREWCYVGNRKEPEPFRVYPNGYIRGRSKRVREEKEGERARAKRCALFRSTQISRPDLPRDTSRAAFDAKSKTNASGGCWSKTENLHITVWMSPDVCSQPKSRICRLWSHPSSRAALRVRT